MTESSKLLANPSWQNGSSVPATPVRHSNSFIRFEKGDIEQSISDRLEHQVR
jgi:hypothetical protein